MFNLDTAVNYILWPWNFFLWILPGHISFGPCPRPILPHPQWLGIRLWRHCRTVRNNSSSQGIKLELPDLMLMLIFHDHFGVPCSYFSAEFSYPFTNLQTNMFLLWSLFRCVFFSPVFQCHMHSLFWGYHWYIQMTDMFLPYFRIGLHGYCGLATAGAVDCL